MASIIAVGVEIGWVAPTECPDGDYVRAVAERHLGRALADDASTLEIRGTITSVGASGYALELVVEGSGRRSLEATECAALADVAGFMIALAIDPTLAPATGDSADEPVASEPATPARAQPIVAAPEVASPAPPTAASVSLRRPAIQAALGIGGGATYGAFTVPSGLLRIDAGLLRGRLRIGASATHHFARSFDGPGDVSARVRVTTAGVFVGFRGLVRKLEFLLGGGLEVGVIHGAGKGAPSSHSARRPWVAPVIGTGVLWAVVPRFAFGARVDGAFPLLRYDYRINGARIASLQPADLRAWLAVELRLP